MPSIGFRNLVSLLPAIQATRLLTFASVGLFPTEHASLCWTHNRTCRFPASGFPTDFATGSRRLTNAIPLKTYDPQLPRHHFGWETSGTATPGGLLASPQKVPHAIIDVGIDLPVCFAQAAVGKVLFPAPQFCVELVAHFLPRLHLARLQQIVYPLLEFADGLLGRLRRRVPPPIFPIPLRSWP